MYNTFGSDKCNNCGADYGLHHYQTDQCPVGGREAPIGRKQEWKTTVFEIETESPEDAYARGLAEGRAQGLEEAAGLAKNGVPHGWGKSFDSENIAHYLRDRAAEIRGEK